MDEELESEWYKVWFNEDYLKLYSNRNMKEAEEQVDFLLNALKLNGNEKILDLGCGIGRHSLLLAKKGFSVVGVDLSPDLLKIARQNAVPFPDLDLTYIQGDMRNLDNLGQFDLVISIFTSFGYFETEEENLTVLKEIKKCLKPKGHFFLDYLHPYYVKNHLVPNEIRVIGNAEVGIHREIIDDKIIKTIQFPHQTYEEKVKLYSRIAIEKILKSAGLSAIEVWNDYEGNPWKSEGDRQLFLCEIHKS